MTTLLFWKTSKCVFLASDSQITAGNLKLPVRYPKIQAVGANCLACGTGSVGNCQQMLKMAIKEIKFSKIMAESEDYSEISPKELSKALANLNFSLPLEHKHFSPFAFLIAGRHDNKMKGL